jgi:hypothetical protein
MTPGFWIESKPVFVPQLYLDEADDNARGSCHRQLAQTLMFLDHLDGRNGLPQLPLDKKTRDEFRWGAGILVRARKGGWAKLP